jgi:hypothetical protein
MPDDALVPAELGSDIDLPRTLLVQLNNKGTVSLAESRMSHLDATIPQELNDRAAGNAEPLGQLPPRRASSVLTDQLLDVCIAQPKQQSPASNHFQWFSLGPGLFAHGR